MATRRGWHFRHRRLAIPAEAITSIARHGSPPQPQAIPGYGRCAIGPEAIGEELLRPLLRGFQDDKRAPLHRPKFLLTRILIRQFDSGLAASSLNCGPSGVCIRAAPPGRDYDILILRPVTAAAVVSSASARSVYFPAIVRRNSRITWECARQP